jgi:hypothetical protein
MRKGNDSIIKYTHSKFYIIADTISTGRFARARLIKDADWGELRVLP